MSTDACGQQKKKTYRTTRVSEETYQVLRKGRDDFLEWYFSASAAETRRAYIPGQITDRFGLSFDVYLRRLAYIAKR